MSSLEHVPLAPFSAERYLLDLRDATAAAPEGTVRECANLWARGCLDVRLDCILIPVLVTPLDHPLLQSLERRNAERKWGLPEGYFRERLAYGGCLLLLEDGATAAPEYSRCPVIANNCAAAGSPGARHGAEFTS